MAVILNAAKIKIITYMKVDKVAKSQEMHRSHAGLDPASSIFNYFWIPAFAGMTVIGLFASPSKLINPKTGPIKESGQNAFKY